MTPPVGRNNFSNNALNPFSFYSWPSIPLVLYPYSFHSHSTLGPPFSLYCILTPSILLLPPFHLFSYSLHSPSILFPCLYVLFLSFHILSLFALILIKYPWGFLVTLKIIVHKNLEKNMFCMTPRKSMDAHCPLCGDSMDISESVVLSSNLATVKVIYSTVRCARGTV